METTDKDFPHMTPIQGDWTISAINLLIDYLAIGPIFSTTTKTDTAPVLGLDGLRR